MQTSLTGKMTNSQFAGPMKTFDLVHSVSYALEEIVEAFFFGDCLRSM